MTNPQRFINRVIVFLILALGVAVTLNQIIWRAFLHNPWLNGLILGVLLLGIAFNVRRLYRLKPEARWIEAYRAGTPGFSLQEAPRLLTGIATALSERDRQRRQRSSLSAMSLRYLLDSVSARLDESRDLARYLTGLLIFLGLLGTFWGLLESINSISGVIASLSLGSGDFVAVFNDMKAGLARPLSGMGTAFSASLFGLAGSLILGFLDLQASQGQNAFYNDVEEWLATQARLAMPDGPMIEGMGGAPMPAYLSALLQQTADNLDRMQQVIARSEDGRGDMQGTMGTLNQRLGALGDRLQRDSETLERLLIAQQELLRQVVQRQEGPAIDAATRDHIRNTDLQLGRLLEELGRGRAELSRELRQEIKLVARTIAIVAGEPEMVRD